MSTFQTFKDLSVTFKKHPVTNDLVSVKDKVAIAQSISNLLQTNKGERPFQPELGSGLRDLLFEPLDYGSSGIMGQVITELISNYEPRVRVQAVDFNPDFMNNGYNIELSYIIVGREDEVVGAEVFLERTR
tara:strand:- start:410 stop:802 length:393 start_codon:yes stop_codon:yes gene_type:complete